MESWDVVMGWEQHGTSWIFFIPYTYCYNLPQVVLQLTPVLGQVVTMVNGLYLQYIFWLIAQSARWKPAFTHSLTHSYTGGRGCHASHPHKHSHQWKSLQSLPEGHSNIPGLGIDPPTFWLVDDRSTSTALPPCIWHQLMNSVISFEQLDTLVFVVDKKGSASYRCWDEKRYYHPRPFLISFQSL